MHPSEVGRIEEYNVISLATLQKFAVGLSVRGMPKQQIAVYLNLSLKSVNKLLEKQSSINSFEKGGEKDL